MASAAAGGLGLVAVTDHDTLSGLPEALAAGTACGVEVLCGVELSTARSGGRLHVLGYLPRPDPEPLAGVVAGMRAEREARARRIVARLARRGVELPFEAVARRAAGAIGRPHIAAALVELGVVGSVQEAFDRFLGDDGEASEPAGRLDAADAVRLLVDSGGVAVLAHPYTLGLSPGELRAELVSLRDVGLSGVEAYRADHDGEQRAAILALASELGLVATGGSDFHSVERGEAIGAVGDVLVPPASVERLRAVMISRSAVPPPA